MGHLLIPGIPRGGYAWWCLPSCANASHALMDKQLLEVTDFDWGVWDIVWDATFLTRSGNVNVAGPQFEYWGYTSSLHMPIHLHLHPCTFLTFEIVTYSWKINSETLHFPRFPLELSAQRFSTWPHIIICKTPATQCSQVDDVRASGFGIKTLLFFFSF